jgi:uncharacterized protein
MKKVVVSIFVSAVLLCCSALIFAFADNNTGQKQSKVLVFYKTNGFYHQSIPVGITAIQKLARENGFACDTTKDSLQFNSKNLDQYAAVIFLNTTMDVLGEAEQTAFQKYIRSGKGYAGVHAACDTEYDWPWYNQLVGAYFKSHPKQQKAKLKVTDNSFVATRHLPAEWNVWDEWYNFKNTHWDKMKVLITLDETSIEGGQNGDFHPVSWYHEFDGGRSFYTALGHTDELYSDSLFLKHLLGGIQYAIGK